MTEKKKSQIQKIIIGIEAVLAAVLLAYLIYGIVTKNSNPVIFNGLAITLVVVSVILNDFVEPILLKRFEEMDDFQKDAYKKYVLWDVASWAGLLIFILTFGSDDTTFLIIGVGLYVISSTKKRDLRPAYLGEVTKEDVEAAKAAADTEEEKTEE